MSKSAYFVIDVKIHDSEGIRPYHEKVADTYKPFGGERIVAGGIPEALEGEPPLGRIVILKFPDLERAHAWHNSPAYQVILGHCQRQPKSDPGHGKNAEVKRTHRKYQCHCMALPQNGEAGW